MWGGGNPPARGGEGGGSSRLRSHDRRLDRGQNGSKTGAKRGKAIHANNNAAVITDKTTHPRKYCGCTPQTAADSSNHCNQKLLLARPVTKRAFRFREIKTRGNPRCTKCVKMTKLPSSVKCSDQDDLSIAYAKTCTDPISFDDVFDILQEYKRENNGSLTIRPDHPCFPKIIDALASLRIDSVILKRWLQRLALVRSLELNVPQNEKQQHNSLTCTPMMDPDVGTWIQTQLDYCCLHNQGLPNPLSSGQLRMLSEIGLQTLLKLRSVANARKETPLDPLKTSKNASENFRLEETERTSMSESSNIPALIKQESVFNSPCKSNPYETSFVSELVKEETKSTSTGIAASGIKQETAVGSNSNTRVNGHEKNNSQIESISDKSDVAIKHGETDKEDSAEMKGKCDVCRKRDGHKGHNLQQCKVCGLKVHELCYGLIATQGKNPDFVCYACAAVGRQIEVNVPSRVGGPGKKNKREFMTQEARPTECVLCSFDDGSIHAMHPIMDTHGEHGRQLVLPKTSKKEKRLAWAHTLCATFICTNPITAGCVYGLDQDNEFQLDNDEEEESNDDQSERESCAEGGEEDTEAGAEEGSTSKDKESNNLSSLCAYAIAGRREDWLWTNRIKECRTYKCFICGEDDTHVSSLRIPIQCIVDDEEDYEYIEFRDWRQNFAKQHPEPEFVEEKRSKCSVAMHVGCARWKADLEKVSGKAAHLVYFYPGQQQGELDAKFQKAVANCYCTAHAREVILGNPKNAVKKDNIPVHASEVNVERPQKKRNLSATTFNHQIQNKRVRKVPGPKKSNVPPMISDPKPFGKRDSGVIVSDVREEEFVVLGKAGKALSRKTPGNSNSLKKLQQNPVAKVDDPVIPLAAKSSELSRHISISSSKASNSLRSILNKVVKGDESQVLSAATKLDDSSTLSRTTKPNAVPGNTFSLKLPPKKPVGILKNKTPGPIIGDRGSVEEIVRDRQLS
ncbi:hypothetical protein HJC23_011460 [Cyclotella cryptica]|uniref:Uncharacterized protein n=1 Tax=Cyclotella cryptica TaxID=29204 RepID=A0ABD3NUC4_9STRA|eukprot:CCRYP_019870-RA/>CCRYP_019870-RA protein AED:0.42 eAED:1.00 QI:0/-1/0/1/-1/1/1/0/965